MELTLPQARPIRGRKKAPLLRLGGGVALTTPGPPDWPGLVAAGACAVVDLGDPSPSRAAAARGHGLRYLALPVGPESIPVRGELHVAASWLEARAAEGTAVIVDYAGRDSDCMFAMAWLIRRGWRFERAYERVRRLRPGFVLAEWQSRALLLHLAQTEPLRA